MFPSSPQHHPLMRPQRWFLSIFCLICCCTFANAMHNACMMKMTSITRDHRETFTSKMIRLCEKFVGKDHDADEIGIDDQYTQFFYSKDVTPDVRDWIYNNRYSVYHLVDDITFRDLDDLIAQVNARGMEWDEEWEPLDKDSKTRGGLFG